MKRFFSGILLSFAVFLFAENPLTFGNPTNAGQEDKNNFLLVKEGYTLSYNDSLLGANWVAWHLDENDLGDSGRSNSFKNDTSLPENFYQVTSKDYQYAAYGFDRGHLCPSADRTATTQINKETFLMTNMLPQAPNLNRKVWMHLENYEREMTYGGNELYIFAGGWGKGGDGDRGYFTEIPVSIKDNELSGKSIAVPQFCWKIILQLPSGDDDLSRISEDTKILAVFMPNTQSVSKSGDWEQYLVTVDFLEAVTGLDFFDLLPDEIEEKIESRLYTK